MWITGQVCDDRGRALPDVTIEASGPLRRRTRYDLRCHRKRAAAGRRQTVRVSDRTSGRHCSSPRNPEFRSAITSAPSRPSRFAWEKWFVA